MGYYINPLDETKESFLERVGTKIDVPPLNYTEILPKMALVCLVDSGALTAAGIVYDQLELDEFDRSDDHRPKTWYLVPRDGLWRVSSIRDTDFE